MKIAIATKNMLSGGAERVISQLSGYFVSHGQDCEIITLYKDEIFYQLDPKVSVYQIDAPTVNQISDKYTRYRDFRRYIKKSKPDIILSMPEEIGIYVLLTTVGSNIPVIVSERNDPWIMPPKKVTRLLRQLMYPRAKGIIFQTKKASMFFHKDIRAKSIVLPNPLDLTRLPEPYKGDRDKVIVSVGRLEPQKNFRLLIDAMVIVQKRHPDYKLIVYGEGNERNSLEAYAGEKLIKNSWEFPGRDDDVLNKIRKMACFVLTSDFEGVPNALIEAVAIGIPSVSTDCKPGGAREIIINKKNGFLVPVGDANALGNRISRIIDNPSIAEQFSEEGIKIRRKFDEKIVGKQWLSFLTEMAEV